jgi:hypothetical protein
MCTRHMNPILKNTQGENRLIMMHVLKAMGPINNGPNSPDFCSLWMAVGR